METTTVKSCLALALASALVVGPGVAQTPESPDRQTRLEARRASRALPPPAQRVQQVLVEMHRGNQLEIRLGELAREKGQWENVRDFGERIARDHRMGDGKVMALAEKNGVDVQTAMAQTEQEAQARARRTQRREAEKPPEAATRKPEPSPRQMARKLEQAPPDRFDRMYLDAMVKLHQRTIERLEKARKSGPDEDLRGLIEKLLPILRQHHDLAAALRSQGG